MPEQCNICTTKGSKLQHGICIPNHPPLAGDNIELLCTSKYLHTEMSLNLYPHKDTLS